MTEEDFAKHLPDPATLTDDDIAELEAHWNEFEKGYPLLAAELEKEYGHHVEDALKERKAKKGSKKAQKGSELEAEYDRLVK
jgi:hypothetical protein